MTPSKILKAIAVPTIVALAVATAIIAIAPAEAAPSQPVIRDHRNTKWQPRVPKWQKPPVVRDHRGTTWQPKPHWQHY